MTALILAGTSLGALAGFLAGMTVRGESQRLLHRRQVEDMAARSHRVIEDLAARQDARIVEMRSKFKWMVLEVARRVGASEAEIDEIMGK